jgi:hypothetical protein
MTNYSSFEKLLKKSLICCRKRMSGKEASKMLILIKIEQIDKDGKVLKSEYREVVSGMSTEIIEGTKRLYIRTFEEIRA